MEQSVEEYATKHNTGRGRRRRRRPYWILHLLLSHYSITFSHIDWLITWNQREKSQLKHVQNSTSLFTWDLSFSITWNEVCWTYIVLRWRQMRHMRKKKKNYISWRLFYIVRDDKLNEILCPLCPFWSRKYPLAGCLVDGNGNLHCINAYIWLNVWETYFY